MVGQNGGGFFVLIYLLFLLLLGVPIMTMEYAVGRASHRSILPAYRALEPAGTHWHLTGYLAMAGNYVILMFYSVVSGWILHYAILMASGRFAGADMPLIEEAFNGMMGSHSILIGSMMIIMLITSIICGIGLQNGVEKITKIMMLLLILIMVLLGIRSMLLPGGAQGLKFYLMPSLSNMRAAGIGNVVYSALNQSFFTLSLGMGGMEIFGSYIDKDRGLLGEASVVAALDTFVAITAGLIIFPACFSYGISVDAGPKLIFLTLPRVFSMLPGGRLWGSLFFLFLFFAALSTMIGVFENILSFSFDLLGTPRRKSALINGLLITVLSVPCALGFNLWAGFEPLRAGNSIMDLEDFFVSNLCLPFGSLMFILFCTSRYGWGFRNYLQEVNTGSGMKMPAGMKLYLQWVLPLLVGFLVVYGIISYF